MVEMMVAKTAEKLAETMVKMWALWLVYMKETLSELLWVSKKV
jgi:hypothetical protein